MQKITDLIVFPRYCSVFLKVIASQLIAFCATATFAQPLIETDSSDRNPRQTSKYTLPAQQADQEETILFENSRNLFLNTLSKLGLWNFPVRGVSTNHYKIAINGLWWNLPEDQSIPFDDLTMLYGNTEIESGAGLEPSLSGNSGLKGNSNFVLQPLSLQKCYQLGYTVGTGNTTHQFRVKYESGRLKGGWGLAFSLINRLTKEGYTPGISLDSKMILATIKKDISQKQSITLSVFGNISERSFSSEITKETAELTQDFQYNPNWGYQLNKKRNTNQQQTSNPAAILNYENKLSQNTAIGLAVSFQHEIEQRSTLDWFHAYNPRPDYYQNLPSYYYQKETDLNDFAGNTLSNQWKEKPFQTDWNNLYAANYANRFSSLTGELLPALYVLSDDVTKRSILRAAANFQHSFYTTATLSGGAQFIHSMARNFRELTDLLGGNYFLNLNQFALNSYGQTPGWEQFDLKSPNRKILKGDKYFYDYSANTDRASIWLISAVTKNRFIFSISGDIDFTGYQRTGNYQSGIFVNNSYGLSSVKHFFTHQGKLSIQYNFGRESKVWLTGCSASNAPSFDHTFYDPRIRNSITPGLVTEKIQALETGAEIKHKNWEAGLTAFTTSTKGQTDVLQFYHDDYRTYVHMLLNGINTAQRGVEFAAIVRPASFLEINFIAVFLQSLYSSRPAVTLFRDNDTAQILENQTVYWKNYSAIKGPQSIAGVQFHFQLPHQVYMNISGSWQDHNYVSLNPSRYTEAAVYLLKQQDAKRQLILDQEKLPACYLANFETGKVFRFKKSSSNFLRKSNWHLSFGIQNLFNLKGYALYGSEQLRFDFDRQDPTTFPNKYRFGTGRTFFLSLQFSEQ